MLKPKVKDFGFNEEELTSVSESIANGLSSVENPSDEEITARIDAVVPFLKLAQSASNRSIERFKAQSKQEPKKEPQPEPKKEPQQNAPTKDDYMAAFNEFKDAMSKQLEELRKENASMKAEKLNETLMAKVKSDLKDVDANFYGLSLEGRQFASEEEANDYVGKVKSGWESLCKAKNIQSMSHVVPPAGNANPQPDKPSEAVQARIEARTKAQTTQPSAIKVSSPIKTS